MSVERALEGGGWWEVEVYVMPIFMPERYCSEHRVGPARAREGCKKVVCKNVVGLTLQEQAHKPQSVS
jgi:hypothetical protein